jgi:hypothetical protein
MKLTDEEKKSTTVQFDCQAPYGKTEAVQTALSSGVIEDRLYEEEPQACNYKVRYFNPAYDPSISYEHQCRGDTYSLRYSQDSIQCQDSTPYVYWEDQANLACTDVDPNPPPPVPIPSVTSEKNLGGCIDGVSPQVSD